MDNTLKTVFAVGFALAVIGALLVVVDTLRDIKASIPAEPIIVTESSLGGVADDINFSQVRTATTTCNSFSATFTQLVATTTGRTSFEVQNLSSSSVYLCRDSVCGQNPISIGRGRLLTATGTISSLYEQRDGYFGPYSCATNGPSSSTISYSQGT